MKKLGDLAVAERPRKVLNVIDTATGIGARTWFETMLRRARTDGVFMVEENLTDPIARLLLENNDANRRGSAATIKEMAKAMKDGAFDGLNGETIKVSICGQLNDGQHRCHARLEAGVDIKTRFMFGLPRESRLTIDQGKLRAASDYLTMSGKEGGLTATSAASMLWLWKVRKSLKKTSGNAVDRLGKSALSEYATKHHERIMASIDALPRRGAGTVGGFSLMVFAHMVLSEIDRAAATDFIIRTITGEGLLDGNPILVLRERLMSKQRLNHNERFELIIRAWNAHRAGERKVFLQLRNAFPDISR